MSRLARLPFFVLLMGAGALSMLGPAILALADGDEFVARTFLWSGLLFLVLTGLIGLALGNYRPESVVRSQLLALLAAFTLLPAMLAVPLYEAQRELTFVDAWFEMVSSVTTTGATLFDLPGMASAPVHYWRVQTGWLGGYLMWVAAFAIFQPMKMGGFEIQAQSSDEAAALRLTQFSGGTDPAERLARFAGKLLPIYAGLTLLLALGLILAGDRPFVALSHAMSTLATSAISPVGGLEGGNSGFVGEVLVFCFLLFALSRLTFSRGILTEDRGSIWTDPEFRLGLALVVAVPLLLFLRHWVGALDADSGPPAAAQSALWGAVFTVLSFLTTTGFEIESWGQTRLWSGLETPGLVLMGLALVGGGVATTAGGVKLLRVYALYKHGRREIDRLIYPHMVGGSGPLARHIRRQGAYIAWIFFMLFAVSVAVIMVAMSLTGVTFETNLVLTVAALSNTGPLATVVGEFTITYAAQPDAAKVVLAAAMVLGRLETLAIIALLNPDFWRH